MDPDFGRAEVGRNFLHGLGTPHLDGYVVLILDLCPAELPESWLPVFLGAGRALAEQELRIPAWRLRGYRRQPRPAVARLVPRDESREKDLPRLLLSWLGLLQILVISIPSGELIQERLVPSSGLLERGQRPPLVRNLLDFFLLAFLG